MGDAWADKLNAMYKEAAVGKDHGETRRPSSSRTRKMNPSRSSKGLKTKVTKKSETREERLRRLLREVGFDYNVPGAEEIEESKRQMGKINFLDDAITMVEQLARLKQEKKALVSEVNASGMALNLPTPELERQTVALADLAKQKGLIKVGGMGAKSIKYEKPPPLKFDDDPMFAKEKSSSKIRA